MQLQRTSSMVVYTNWSNVLIIIISVVLMLLTFLLKCKIFCQMSTLVIATQ